MKDKIIEIFGWYGAVVIVLAYALISFSLISTENIWYQILNLTGALGMVTISFYKRTYQPGVVNIIWSVIALMAIGKILL